MTTTNKTATEKLTVRVRMYTQGLGDCFLLTFSRGAEKFNLLIDCGVLQGTEDAQRKMSAVVQNIKSETGGDDETNCRLNLVIATHEHWDHISGFAQARADFDQIDFDAIWLGWTEDGNNRQARELKRIQEARREAIKKAKAVGKSQSLGAMFKRIDKLLDFEGPGEDLDDGDDEGEPLGVASGRRTGKQKAWDYLTKEKDAERKYCRPGQLLELDGFAGVRVYVLGPPEDEALLRRSDPRKGGDEVFEQSFGLTLEDVFFGAVNAAAAGAVNVPGGNGVPRPFDEHIGVTEDEAKLHPRYQFFKTRYGFDQHDGLAWRRIDDDWLSMAGELALNLDRDTNNTCLAVAIELVESGQVLLFPGDAQVGNWLSWESLSWKIKGQDEPITSGDLLERTVLYKVGHHGSHNATLKQKGLELMESPELVAILPVDEVMAKKQDWNHMPLKSLLKRLQEKTRGRVLRADMDKSEGLREMKKAARDFITPADWERFEKKLEVGGNYIDYTISE